MKSQGSRVRVLGFRVLGAQFALVVAGTGGREGGREGERERSRCAHVRIRIYVVCAIAVRGVLSYA